MTRWMTLAGASLVAFSLALPASSWAQARSRGGDSSPSSSGSSGSQSGGGDSSGGARSAPQSGSSGSARPRSGSGASSGGTASSGSQASVGRSSAADGSSGSARARGSQPARGEAQPRTGIRPIYRDRPGYVVRSYDPWFYDPWYGYGYSYGYGPYGYSRWNRYPYGVGFGVFGGPFGFYDPYLSYGYGPYDYGGGYDRRADRDEDRQPTGAVRFRANPKHARVYVDGALVGTVDEFDGLSDHLELSAGRHEIELRADGYQSYTSEVDVRANRTVTERANLKKVN